MSRIRVRRGTTSEWTAANPVLLSGEPGLDTTTGVFKVGDGSTPWLTLAAAYAPTSSIAALQNVTTPTLWTTPPFATGWASYGGGYNPVAYRKIGDIVYLRGLLNAITGVTATMWTFPVGFRPPSIILTGAMTSAGAWRRIDIQTTGVATMTSPAVGEWFALEGIQFSVTP